MKIVAGEGKKKIEILGVLGRAVLERASPHHSSLNFCNYNQKTITIAIVKIIF